MAQKIIFMQEFEVKRRFSGPLLTSRKKDTNTFKEMSEGTPRLISLLRHFNKPNGN